MNHNQIHDEQLPAGMTQAVWDTLTSGVQRAFKADEAAHAADEACRAAMSPEERADEDAAEDDRRYRFTKGSKVLADLQYEIADIAHEGRITLDENESMQMQLVEAWECLYHGTIGSHAFVGSERFYSDGRPMVTRTSFDGEAENAWPSNPLIFDDGATQEFHRCAEYVIVDPRDEIAS